MGPSGPISAQSEPDGYTFLYVTTLVWRWSIRTAPLALTIRSAIFAPVRRWWLSFADAGGECRDAWHSAVDGRAGAGECRQRTLAITAPRLGFTSRLVLYQSAAGVIPQSLIRCRTA